MKKINIILISILAIVLASCVSQDTPKQTVRSYYNAMQDEEFYEAAKFCLPSAKQNLVQQAEQLRTKYSKFVKYYRIVGVQQINDTEAIAVVRIKSPLNDITGDILDMVDLTKEGDTWYIGKKPNKDMEELMRALEEEKEDGWAEESEDEEFEIG